MILGRTFEKFTIPNGYAGKLEGRSSYARLGLTVHCTGDFINPGWRGRMPIQIVNHGIVPITVVPHLLICQLLVMKTSSPSVCPYSNSAKYADDEGGPSKFWMDDSLAKLQDSIGHRQLPQNMQNQFLEAFGYADPDLMDRFSDYITMLRADEITNARDVMEHFADLDTKRNARAKKWIIACRVFGFLTFGSALSGWATPPYTQKKYVIWVISAVLFTFGIWGWFFAREPSQPFTRRDLEEYFAETKKKFR